MPFNSKTLDRIKPLSQMTYNVKALIFGPPGCGKTIFGARAPGVCHLDADGTGAMSIYNFPELVDNVNVLPVHSFSEMIDVFEGYRAGDPRVRNTQTFVIDTISQLAKVHLDGFIDGERATNPNRDPVPYQRDYKFNTEAMRRMIQWFLSLDTNLVVLCHSEDHKDERTGFVTKKPYLTPRLLSSMEAVFDVFGYMSHNSDDNSDNSTRTLQVQPTRTIWAKSRIGTAYLPAIFSDPSFASLLYAKEQMINAVREYQQQRQQQQQTIPTGG